MRPSFGPPPPIYRSIVKVLHWTALAFVVAALFYGNVPVVKWGLLATAVLWSVGYGSFGLLCTPGPVLTGILRKGFAPLHIAMLILLDVTALMLLNADPGPLTGALRTVTVLTLGAGLLHGIFHLWRHTALGDGALRNMTPRFMHNML
ncbi:hypothetical protein [uncultured Roseobacter sp.]|uniref:hypothetical protein n=1 Tax=uncultured Roseobacter sp. TaxID=114847 RepID=UPI00262A74D0|nr:hypothetical protein [uncultured Roseobacter sp.]